MRSPGRATSQSLRSRGGLGVSESCLAQWLKIADREDGVSGSASPAGGDLEAENRALRKRAKQLEQENEILRRATASVARDVLPN